MTEEEKIHIAAEKLWDAYGDGTCDRLADILWCDQPEGVSFWHMVYKELVEWQYDGKPA